MQRVICISGGKTQRQIATELHRPPSVSVKLLDAIPRWWRYFICVADTTHFTFHLLLLSCSDGAIGMGISVALWGITQPTQSVPCARLYTPYPDIFLSSLFSLLSCFTHIFFIPLHWYCGAELASQRCNTNNNNNMDDGYHSKNNSRIVSKYDTIRLWTSARR
jgi:hypothetical protein